LYNDADEFYKSIDTIINKFLKGEWKCETDEYD
jgi:hypothetical protein